MLSTALPSGDRLSRLKRAAAERTRVVVFPATKISGHGYEEIGLNSIYSGEPVVVVGSLSGGAGGVVDAARIFVEPKPGEVAIPSIELVTEGVVQAQPSGESFTIETGHGAIDTVEVSPSTTYSRARPVPGIPQPTLSDVLGADFVGVSGSISGTTVKADEHSHRHPSSRRPSKLKDVLRARKPRCSRSGEERYLQRPNRCLRQPTRHHPVPACQLRTR